MELDPSMRGQPAKSRQGQYICRNPRDGIGSQLRQERYLPGKAESRARSLIAACERSALLKCKNIAAFALSALLGGPTSVPPLPGFFGVQMRARGTERCDRGASFLRPWLWFGL